MTFTKQHISFVEYGVFRYPPGLEGWRCYRIEYGGHAEDCIKECVIWLPPNLDPDDIEALYRKAQGFPEPVWE